MYRMLEGREELAWNLDKAARAYNAGFDVEAHAKVVREELQMPAEAIQRLEAQSDWGKFDVQAFKKAVAEAKGKDPMVDLKIKWLSVKWSYKGYNGHGEAGPQMYSILFRPARPIHIAVMADNLDYFKAHYKEETEFRGTLLMEACLCGSRRIAEYIMQDTKLSYNDCPELLSYIAASMDLSWTMEVAKALAREGMPMETAMPRSLASLAEPRNRSAVTCIFDELRGPAQRKSAVTFIFDDLRKPAGTKSKEDSEEKSKAGSKEEASEENAKAGSKEEAPEERCDPFLDGVFEGLSLKERKKWEDSLTSAIMRVVAANDSARRSQPLPPRK